MEPAGLASLKELSVAENLLASDIQESASPTAWPRGFWNLMFTQFQGAFSDNALRWLVIFPVLASVALSDADKNGFASHASLLFAVPFLLFSTVGGWMADRFSKRSVMVGVKLGEIAIMLFAALALAWEQQSLQLAAICLMGIHSTFFAPAKYGVMPEVLPVSKLSAGNGILELLTFVGIILGTFAGGWLAETLVHQEGWSGVILAALAAVGFLTSLGIAKVPAADPGRKLNFNILGEIWSNLRVMKADRDLWRANWGNTAFFFVATLVQINLALFAQKVFQLKPTEQAWLQAALSLGIGAGSGLAGKLSRGRIEYGLIPPGAGLMALASLWLGWPGMSKPEFTVGLALLGLGGGLFIVPIVSVLQHRPSAQTKGAVQGAASWLSWVGIAAAAIIQTLLSGPAQLSYGQIFWVCGAVAALAGAFVAWSRPRAMPEMLARWRNR
jgi:acyl-[acyl-carrier-protein]-phospholipid O-acyltransferase/long-chain-fatty-acid--[acyl-carrier-protein] ligase